MGCAVSSCFGKVGLPEQAVLWRDPMWELFAVVSDLCLNKLTIAGAVFCLVRP